MKRAVLLGSLVLGSAGLLAVWMQGGGSPADADAPSYRFQAGATDRFDVTWQTQVAATVPVGDAAALDVRSSLAGTWVVTTLRVEPDAVVQRGWLTEVRALDVSIDGRDVGIDPSSLERVVVEMHRRRDGRLFDVRLPEQAPVAARNTLVGLAKGFAVPAPGSGERRTSYGVATDHWEGTRRTTRGYRLTAEVRGQTEVEGSGEVELDEGRLAALRSVEEVRAVDGDEVVFSVEERWGIDRQGAEIQAVDAGLAVVPIARLATRARPVSPDWTTARVVGAVTSHAHGEDTSALLWYGTARLQEDPRARSRVAALAAAPGTPHHRRELALDLLAHTPSGAAEAELLTALRALEMDPRFASYVQRLGFLEDPSVAVDHALRGWSDHGDRHVRRATRLTLGAVGRDLELLREPLADDPDDAAAQLGGLGNAHQAEDLERLLAAASHDEARVRGAALHALRHYEEPEVLAVLLTGAADPHPGVQRAALSELDQRPLDAASLDVLGTVVGEGALAAENLGLLATALMRYTAEPSVRVALRQLLEHPGGSPELRARVRSLLEE